MKDESANGVRFSFALTADGAVTSVEEGEAPSAMLAWRDGDCLRCAALVGGPDEAAAFACAIIQSGEEHYGPDFSLRLAGLLFDNEWVNVAPSGGAEA